MLLDDQNLCIQTSSSFVYGAVPIGASIYIVGDLDTGQSKEPNNKNGSLTWGLRNLTRFFFCRYELRLHQGVPSQHWDLASHQAHAAQRPLQNELRLTSHCQLPTVPPSAESRHVPNQSLSPRHRSASHSNFCTLVISTCWGPGVFENRR